MTLRWLCTVTAVSGLAFSAAAYGQGATPAPREPHGTTTVSPPPSANAPSETPEPGGAANRSSVNKSSANKSPAAEARTAQGLVGRDLVSTDGKKIGEIERIVGSRAIVSVGQAGGMGERTVAIDVARLGVIGSGANAKVQTSMTADELQALPTYRNSGATTAPRTEPPGAMGRGGNPAMPQEKPAPPGGSRY